MNMMPHILFLVFFLTSLGLAAQVPNETVQQSNTVLILGIVGAIATVCTAGISAIVAIYVAKLNSKATTAAAADVIVAEKATAAANKAEEVRVSLQVNRAHTDEKLSKIETLVNGGVEKLLRQTAVALRRAADVVKLPRDVAAAEAAEEALTEHIKMQAEVSATHKEAIKEQKGTSPSGPQIGIGAAVGEVLTDVKVIKQDVKDLKGK